MKLFKTEPVVLWKKANGNKLLIFRNLELILLTNKPSAISFNLKSTWFNPIDLLLKIPEKAGLKYKTSLSIGIVYWLTSLNWQIFFSSAKLLKYLFHMINRLTITKIMALNNKEVQNVAL